MHVPRDMQRVVVEVQCWKRNGESVRCNRLRRGLNHQRRHCSASFLFVVVVFFLFRRILFGSQRLLCSAEAGLSAWGLGLTRAGSL